MIPHDHGKCYNVRRRVTFLMNRRRVTLILNNLSVSQGELSSLPNTQNRKVARVLKSVQTYLYDSRWASACMAKYQVSTRQWDKSLYHGALISIIAKRQVVVLCLAMQCNQTLITSSPPVNKDKAQENQHRSSLSTIIFT